MFENLPGIVCIADDVIIHGKNDEEHDLNIKIFLDKCKTSGIQLNKAKFEHKVSSLTFMGHKVTKDGLQVDTEKVKAIQKFPEPSNVSELRSFLGLVNFVTKFVSHSADLLMPFNNLLKKDVKFIWSSVQQKCFELIKKAVCESTILSYYNPNLELVLENEASEYGLGTALFQNGKPITFASIICQ